MSKRKNTKEVEDEPINRTDIIASLKPYFPAIPSNWNLTQASKLDSKVKKKWEFYRAKKPKELQSSCKRYKLDTGYKKKADLIERLMHRWASTEWVRIAKKQTREDEEVESSDEESGAYDPHALRDMIIDEVLDDLRSLKERMDTIQEQMPNTNSDEKFIHLSVASSGTWKPEYNRDPAQCKAMAPKTIYAELPPGSKDVERVDWW